MQYWWRHLSAVMCVDKPETTWITAATPHFTDVRQLIPVTHQVDMCPTELMPHQTPSTPSPSFSTLPIHLQSLILAHAAVPLNTCTAAAAILQDDHLLTTWILGAAAAGKLQEPLQLAAEHQQWHICSLLIQTLEFGDSDTQPSIALLHAAGGGQLGLVIELLAIGALENSMFGIHAFGWMMLGKVRVTL
jgi:hypothetical protein